MKIILWLAFVFIVLSSLVLSACATPSTQQPEQVSGETLLSQRCAKCHGIDRVKGKQLTQDEWGQLVDRMIGKGAKLTPEERQVLVEYLAQTYGK